MIFYSKKELLKLSDVLNSHFDSSNFYSAVESIIKEFECKYSSYKRIKKALCHILGDLSFGFSEASPYYTGQIYELLYKTPLDRIPLYIYSHDACMRVISKWRLSIEK
jgi:hypothetical protein